MNIEYASSTISQAFSDYKAGKIDFVSADAALDSAAMQSLGGTFVQLPISSTAFVIGYNLSLSGQLVPLPPHLLKSPQNHCSFSLLCPIVLLLFCFCFCFGSYLLFILLFDCW